MGRYQKQLIEHIHLLGTPKGSLPAPGTKDETAKILLELFTWQELEAYAKKKEAALWQQAQELDGPIPPDDTLRQMGNGEHIVAESKRFSCIVKVQDPRDTFDKEEFIKALVKKHGMKATVLNRLAKKCVKTTVPVLCKRIVEA